MEKLRTVHRITGSLILIVLIYLSITGLTMQSIDLFEIFILHRQPADPDLLNEGQPGSEFQILSSDDRGAQALPASLDLNAAFASLVQSAHASLGPDPLRYVELRMLAGRVVGNVLTTQRIASIDSATGALLTQAPLPPLRTVTPLDRLRYRIKEFHRMTIYGNPALWINVIVGVALFFMVITGVCLYLKMWGERRKAGLSGFFWIGDRRKEEHWKRAMHRAIGISAAIFLLVVSFSGEWLAYESLVFGYRMQNGAQQRRAAAAQNGARPNGAANGAGQVGQNAPGANGPRPNGPGDARGQAGGGGNRNNQPQALKDADLPAFLSVTLKAASQKVDGAALKAVRIRLFANGAEGVVIAGNGSSARQFVFNAKTGEVIPRNPQGGTNGFPWGWDAHQLGKQIHRGSYFGVWARFLDLFAGLSLLYLSINGLALYIDFRKQRWQVKKAVMAAR